MTAFAQVLAASTPLSAPIWRPGSAAAASDVPSAGQDKQNDNVPVQCLKANNFGQPCYT